MFLDLKKLLYMIAMILFCSLFLMDDTSQCLVINNPSQSQQDPPDFLVFTCLTGYYFLAKNDQIDRID